MSQVNHSSLVSSPLYTRTLLAGIILGGVAVVTLVSSNWFMQNVGMQWMNGSNPVASFAAQVYGFVTYVSPTFSAALIGAALVMKHLDQRLAPLGTTATGTPPMEDRGE